MAAPIALFVYDRPMHLRRTVESLLENREAADSELFVFSDAPRDSKAHQAVAEVRAYVRSLDGFRNVVVHEQGSNLGLADSIVQGVTRLCSTYGRAIVLEDDVVTSPYFLRYMNDALDTYEDEQAVAHVSGGSYPVSDCGPGDTYFLRVPLCWGWGTWERAWGGFQRDPGVMERFDKEMIRDFDFGGTAGYWDQLVLNRRGAIKTWFAFWYATVFLRHQLALFPARPLVRNIGHDGTGVHCAATDCFDVEASADRVSVERIPVVESAYAVRAHEVYFKSISGGPIRHVRAKLGRLRRGWGW